jgi:phosphatidylinositol alpha-1,6-mannosyltransferase
MTHLLVTNDFPPKQGGIQTYLWELWRRLPPHRTTVLTSAHPDAAEWDATQPFRIVRDRHRVLMPTYSLVRRIDALADEVGASMVLLDPALPLGLVGPGLRHRYGVVLHGAEVTVPGRLPGLRTGLARVLRDAELVVAAGSYPAAEAERAAGGPLPTVVIPPGVDVTRFRPLDRTDREEARRRLGLPIDGLVVLGLSRLVPRKGFDVLLRAAAGVRIRHPELVVVVAGAGRDRPRLERLARRIEAPARFTGRVADEDLPDLHAASDVFAMLCRSRWFGLEQEGYGIVFLEAAAAGVAQLAGDSGGSSEAVVDGVTGTVVRDPRSPRSVRAGLELLLDHPERRLRLGAEARDRVERELAYDGLARRLAAALDGV